MSENNLYSLLENDSIDYKIKAISEITDSNSLHFLASIFNWDDDLRIIESIINNNNCSLGTALMVFELGGGYDKYLSDYSNNFNDFHPSFLPKLEERIDKNDFNNNSIEYVPNLSKVMQYKIKKINPGINSVFISGTNIKM